MNEAAGPPRAGERSPARGFFCPQTKNVKILHKKTGKTVDFSGKSVIMNFLAG